MAYCTRNEVKLSKGWTDPQETKHDALIDLIVDEVASHIDLVSRGGFTWLQANFTEYLDGGLDNVMVTYRPIISVATIHDDSAHEFASGALVAATEYFVVDANRGIIRMKVGTFLPGVSSVKVVYSGGYATLPRALRRLSIDMAVEALNRAPAPEVISVGNRDGNISKFDFESWDEHIMRRLAPLMNHRAC